MAKAFATWTVLPHEPVQKLTENLWTVRGTMPNGKFTRVMSVIKLGSGKLVIHNAIALEEPLMAELQAFGEPGYIMVPNGFHRQDARIYKDRFPAAKVLCPRGSIKRVSQVVAVDGDYSQAPADERVRIGYLEGVKDMEGSVQIQSADGATVIFNDIVCNMPRLSGMSGLFLSPTGKASVPRFGRLMMLKDKRTAAATLAKLATPDLRRIVVSHGATITSDAPAVMESVAAGLYKPKPS
jgi:hypothetical protein